MKRLMIALVVLAGAFQTAVASHTEKNSKWDKWFEVGYAQEGKTKIKIFVKPSTVTVSKAKNVPTYKGLTQLVAGKTVVLQQAYVFAHECLKGYGQIHYLLMDGSPGITADWADGAENGASLTAEALCKFAEHQWNIMEVHEISNKIK